jgi:hypothetical protein
VWAFEERSFEWEVFYALKKMQVNHFMKNK